MQPGIEIQRVADEEALSRAGAGLFVRLARKAIADHGRFIVALSGGSTPRRLLERLTGPPLGDQVAWDRIEFFWGDERAVPPDHADSNYRMVREALLDAVPVPADHVHRMKADRPDREVAAGEYQDEIASVFGVSECGPPPAFDLVLLGMGTDGHTASLFPQTEGLKPTGRWVASGRVGGEQFCFRLHRTGRIRPSLGLPS